MGISTFLDIFKNDTKKGNIPIPAIRHKRFPKYIEAIRPQTNSGFDSNNRGPGRRPHIIRPPRRTALVEEPGMPNESRGPKEPTAAALLAASDTATPVISPVPSLAPFFPIFFSKIYARKEPVVAPAPGRKPMRFPRMELRMEVGSISFSSALVSMLSLMDRGLISPISTSSLETIISSTWLKPNIPITNGTKEMPPIRLRFPKLYLATPEAPSMPMVESITPIAAATMPLAGSSPRSHPMEVKAIKIRAATSVGPKCRPTSAKRGPKMVSMTIPIEPPIKEAMFPVARDLPAIPFLVS